MPYWTVLLIFKFPKNIRYIIVNRTYTGVGYNMLAYMRQQTYPNIPRRQLLSPDVNYRNTCICTQLNYFFFSTLIFLKFYLIRDKWALHFKKIIYLFLSISLTVSAQTIPLHIHHSSLYYKVSVCIMPYERERERDSTWVFHQ